MKLYIIGNGFDLWHGLPTRYNDFYDFAKATLDAYECYYWLGVSDKELWHDFENDLSCFDWKQFYEDHDGTDSDSGPSDFYCLEDDLVEQTDRHVEGIKEAFQEWIEGIDISDAKKKFDFSQDATFITFNYTSTLQSVYGIGEERVFHIHGRANQYDDLIFGHGKTMEEEPEQDENGDSNRWMGTDSETAAKYPFYALQKPVAKVLEANSSRFDSARLADEIIVVGHSLNDIDLPYFKELATRGEGARWLVFCYTETDKELAMKQLIKCGIESSKIQTFGYDDLPDMSGNVRICSFDHAGES